PERLASTRGGSAGRRRLLGDRPRLDERDGGERAAPKAGEAAARRSHHARLDRARLPAGDRVTALPGSIAVEAALLLLKIAFLVLLYLFIWRIVRTAARDLRLPQESFVLAPGSIPGLGEERQLEAGKIVVVKSPALSEGDEWELDSSSLTLGRSSQNDIELKRDEY